MQQEIWKEVFKAGVHTDANGNEREWTQEDLDSIIEKYNNQLPDDKHEAPVVIGHPVNNSPAYAWVEELKRDGETLLAKFAQIDPQFEDLIKEGRFKKVSIALYPDMMLRHVGFLGAIPPAVKGLKDSQFSEDKLFISFDLDKNADKILSDSYANASQTHSESYAIKGKESKRNIYNSSPSKFENFEEGSKNSDTNLKSINFKGGNMPENYTRLFQELLGWLGQTFNEEIANQTAAEFEKIKTKYLNSSEKQDSSKQSTEANDSVQGVDVSQSKEFQELQKKLELLERDNNEMKFNEYFKSQSGRLVPAQKQIVKLAFEAIRNNGSGFQFSENGKTVSLNGEDLVKRLIESFPLQVEFNEIARKDSFSDSTELEEQNKFIDEYNKNK
ncbi:MAG: hypothetical protein HW421_1184 [Ignavibacteria bacterium]|nr:hypothetical protein [Ignavibacteria bacterium]